MPLAHPRIPEALIPDLAEQQHALGLCGIEQTFEQHEHLARLHVDFGADGKLIEPIGGKALVDFGCGNGIDPPAQGILQCVKSMRRNAASIAFWRQLSRSL